MKSEFAKYSMQGTGRAILGFPVLGVSAFVAKDAVHAILAKTARDGAGKDADGQQQSLDYFNYHLQSHFAGSRIAEKCTTEQPDDQAAYIQCAKDEILPFVLSIELAVAIGAAVFAIPMINRAWGYFSLASNAQKDTLVHNFLGIMKPKKDPNEYDPRFDPSSDMFDPGEEGDDHELGQDESVAIQPYIPTKSAFESDVSFKIHNGIAPTAEIILQPGDAVYAETGSLLSMDSGIEMKLVRTKGADGLLSGESLIQSAFANFSTRPRSLVLTPKTKGEIVEIDMSQEDRILCNNGAFFASYNSVDVRMMRLTDKSIRTFSGLGWSVQEIVSGEEPARILLASSGQVYMKELRQGEKASVQGDAVLAMSQTLQISLKEIKGGANRIFGGEGKFLLDVHGPGKVWLSTKIKPDETESGSGIFSAIRGLIPGA